MHVPQTQKLWANFKRRPLIDAEYGELDDLFQLC